MFGQNTDSSNKRSIRIQSITLISVYLKYFVRKEQSLLQTDDIGALGYVLYLRKLTRNTSIIPVKNSKFIERSIVIECYVKGVKENSYMKEKEHREC